MMKVALLVVVAILHGGHYGRGLGWEVLMCGVVCWVGCVVVRTRIESVRMMGGLLLALFTDKNIEPSMNATSSHMPTAKSGFGCQKINLALWLPKEKFCTIPAKNENRHDCA
jgi:hypothetical protein